MTFCFNLFSVVITFFTHYNYYYCSQMIYRAMHQRRPKDKTNNNFYIYIYYANYYPSLSLSLTGCCCWSHHHFCVLLSSSFIVVISLSSFFVIPTITNIITIILDRPTYPAIHSSIYLSICSFRLVPSIILFRIA